MAVSVDAYLREGHLASTFFVLVELLPGRSPRQALSYVDERLDHIRAPRARFDRSFFATSRAPLLSELLFAAESHQGRASMIQTYNQDAGTPDYVGVRLSGRSLVTVEDLRKAYYDLLPSDRRVVAFVVPTPGAPRSGRLAGSP